MTDFQKILEECLRGISAGTSTVDECLARYPELATQLRPLLRTVLFLNLGRDRSPSPAFRAPARAGIRVGITRYLQSHLYWPRSMPLSWRTALASAMLVAAFLVTGTAYAQTALPGDSFYGWKRKSEQVWRAVSDDKVATEIVLSNRRLNEWIAVADDPTRSASAMDDYFAALTRLNSMEDEDKGSLARIMPVLQSHQEMLNEAGYSDSEVEDYLTVVLASYPTAAVTQVPPRDPPGPKPTAVPTEPEPSEPEPTAVPTEPEPSEPEPTAVPTEPVPTAVPTEPVPTTVPTEPVPTAVPTEPVPTEPVPTEPLPTESAPTAAPTEFVPTVAPEPETTPSAEIP